MFKRLGRALGTKPRTKLRLDVQIKSLQRIPQSVSTCRVVWARDAKVQMTKAARVENGTASWGEELSIIATLDMGAKGKFEPKIYDFRVQALDSQQRFVTLGKVTVDMAQHVDARQQQMALQVDLPGGVTTVLTIVLTATPVKGLIGDDDASVISGVSGMSGSPVAMEQDLNGFEVSGSRSSAGVLPPSPLSSSTLSESQETGGATGAGTGAGAGHTVVPIPIPAAAVQPSPPIEEEEDVQLSTIAEHEADEESPSAAAASAASASSGAVNIISEGKSPSPPPPTTVASPPPPASEPSAVSAVEEEEEVSFYGDSEPAAQDSYQEGEEEGGSYMAEEREHEGQGEYEEHGEGVYEEAYGDAEFEELIERLKEAQAGQLEAEAVAEEAVGALEAEQSAKRQAEGMVTQLQRELEWAGKKAAKERAEWEARMKDSFKKMEGTVLLTERIQREKSELTDRLTKLAEEKRELEGMLDPTAVQRKIAEAATAAREAAEAQAAIETEALRKRIREMESFVEEADAKALKATGKASHLQAQLAGARGGGGGGAGAPGGEGWEEVRAAEERADSMSLELQYAKAECRSLEQDVRAAKADADRSILAARREAESHAARASDFARQLEEARAAATAAERAASQAQSRVVLLEDAVERSNLQAAELRQRLAAARSSSSTGADATPSADLQLAMQQVREVQDAAEARAAQLSATSRELVAAQEAAATAMTELRATKQDLADVQRMVSAREDEVRQLKEELQARQAQKLELKQLQRDMAALLAGGATARTSPRPGSAGSNAYAVPGIAAQAAAAAQTAETNNNNNNEDINALRRRNAESQELARSAATQAAELVQQLAAAQAERLESDSRVSEMREELVKLRSGSQGELRVRIETLERDLVVSRNRAEVNALFGQEHERIAGELIGTKLALAEAQEQLVVLRRALIKSQERSMSFASKLTSLETKLYRKLTSVASRKKSGRGSSASEEASERAPTPTGDREESAAGTSPGRKQGRVGKGKP